MLRRIIRGLLTLFTLALVSTIIALAQSTGSTEIVTIPARDTDSHSWQAAHLTGPSKGKLFVVTVDKPDRRQSCHIRSFTKDKLVCSRAIGGPRTYLPQQVVALILPGDEKTWLPWFLGFNGGSGAAIWGTVVLAATCPACAVGTGIAAFMCYWIAGEYLDAKPSDRLLYLAPGQQLSRKLGYVEE
jgi:hypothetical protein